VAGEYVLRLSASDGTQSAADTATITVIARPFDVWRTANFDPAELADEGISHPLANPDQDYLPNLGEYIFASAPKLPSSASSLTVAALEERFQATWMQRAELPDVVITPERADRLEGPWFSGWEFFDRTTVPQGELIEVTIREKLPRTGLAGGFIRLRYSLR
jgi:hypothetical protein